MMKGVKPVIDPFLSSAALIPHQTMSNEPELDFEADLRAQAPEACL